MCAVSQFLTVIVKHSSFVCLSLAVSNHLMLKEIPCYCWICQWTLPKLKFNLVHILFFHINIIILFTHQSLSNKIWFCPFTAHHNIFHLIALTMQCEESRNSSLHNLLEPHVTSLLQSIHSPECQNIHKINFQTDRKKN